MKVNEQETFPILKKYFDLWKLTISRKYNLTGPQEKGIEVLSKRYKLNPSEIRTILRLAIERTKITYTSNEIYLDQIEALYNALKDIPAPEGTLFNTNTKSGMYTKGKAPIKELKVKFANGKNITINSEVLLLNLCSHFYPQIVKEFETYIKPTFVPKEKRKRKGKSNSAKQRAIKKLSFQVLTFLKEETDLQQKQIGDFIAELFALANINLNASGKSLYDTIKRSV